jgi:hypothetical protein
VSNMKIASRTLMSDVNTNRAQNASIQVLCVRDVIETNAN